MGRSTTLAAVLVALLLLAIAFFVVAAPFMLPNWAYETIYGWRYPKIYRCGDAVVRDDGPRVASHRYRADLGTLPLTIDSRSYRLCKLPNVQLHVGVIAPYSPNEMSEDKRRLRGTNLGVQVRSVSGGLVRSYSGDLADEWTWNVPYQGHAFLYSHDLSFVPEQQEFYELVVTLEGTSLSPDLGSRLLLTGGGWK